jgi:hypothetical protein
MLLLLVVDLKRFDFVLVVMLIRMMDKNLSLSLSLSLSRVVIATRGIRSYTRIERTKVYARAQFRASRFEERQFDVHRRRCR